MSKSIRHAVTSPGSVKKGCILKVIERREWVAVAARGQWTL